MQFTRPEINISVFDKKDVITASGGLEEALAWISGSDGSDSVSEENVADFANIYD